MDLGIGGAWTYLETELRVGWMLHVASSSENYCRRISLSYRISLRRISPDHACTVRIRQQQGKRLSEESNRMSHHTSRIRCRASLNVASSNRSSEMHSTSSMPPLFSLACSKFAMQAQGRKRCYRCNHYPPSSLSSVLTKDGRLDT